GRRCEPLTVMDTASRFLLALEACATPAEAEAWPVFERLFAEHGLPERFRSDNGSPYPSPSVARSAAHRGSGTSPCNRR
ncbi:hypothetical protein AB9F35_36395, partial [Rhizobium leguminosarum]